MKFIGKNIKTGTSAKKTDFKIKIEPSQKLKKEAEKIKSQASKNFKNIEGQIKPSNLIKAGIAATQSGGLNSKALLSNQNITKAALVSTIQSKQKTKNDIFSNKQNQSKKENDNNNTPNNQSINSKHLSEDKNDKGSKDELNEALIEISPKDLLSEDKNDIFNNSFSSNIKNLSKNTNQANVFDKIELDTQNKLNHTTQHIKSDNFEQESNTPNNQSINSKHLSEDKNDKGSKDELNEALIEISPKDLLSEDKNDIFNNSFSSNSSKSDKGEKPNPGGSPGGDPDPGSGSNDSKNPGKKILPSIRNFLWNNVLKLFTGAIISIGGYIGIKKFFNTKIGKSIINLAKKFLYVGGTIANVGLKTLEVGLKAVEYIGEAAMKIMKSKSIPLYCASLLAGGVVGIFVGEAFAMSAIGVLACGVIGSGLGFGVIRLYKVTTKKSDNPNKQHNNAQNILESNRNDNNISQNINVSNNENRIQVNHMKSKNENNKEQIKVSNKANKNSQNIVQKKQYIIKNSEVEKKNQKSI